MINNINLLKKNLQIENLKKKNFKIVNLSVIVCTHKGSEKLFYLLYSIYNSTYVPEEVIIIGTHQNDFKHIKIYNKILNIKFIISPKADQVYQRKIGFKNNRSNFILQSDDDIEFSQNCIEILYTEIIKNKNYIICPLIVDEKGYNADKRSVDKYNNNYFLKKLFFILNGFREVHAGSVLRSGRPVTDINEKINRQWLNSSLCFSKENLKYYKTFNNKGKAFYEDVFTSHSFFINGFKLKKINQAKIIHKSKDPFSFNEHIKSLSNQYKIVKNFNKSKILFILDAFIFSIVFFIYK